MAAPRRGTCRVLALDGLIDAKLATGRTEDSATAKELAAIRDPRRKQAD
jgi:hypothetical protein